MKNLNDNKTRLDNDLKGLLKIKQSDLNPKQSKILDEFLDSEKKAKIELTKLTSKLDVVDKKEKESFKNSLDKSSLTEIEKEKAKEIFTESILKRMEQTVSEAFDSIKNKKGRLYNAMLSETVIDVLDMIQDFKKQIDQYLPIPSHEILSMAAPYLTAIVAISSPGIALAMKSTGIIEKTADFLETKNLTKTIDDLRGSLASFKKDKSLSELALKPKEKIVNNKNAVVGNYTKKLKEESNIKNFEIKSRH